MGLLQSTPQLPSSASVALPGTPGGPVAFPCFPSGQFLCARQDAQCAALADFYCTTNGWLWAQGFQGAGWSAAAGCYASTPAMGCIAPVAPVATDYCTFYGVNCTADGAFVTALVFESLGTAGGNIFIPSSLSSTLGWGSSPMFGNRAFQGYYTPTDETLWTVERTDLWDCEQSGLSFQQVTLNSTFPYYACVGALLNASTIPGPWFCPSYMTGGSTAPAVSPTSSPSAAWNFSVLSQFSAHGNGGSFVWQSALSCTVGLATSVASSFGFEQQSCIGCFMYGSLPASIGNLTGLTSLVLNQNLLSGSLPDSLASLTNLTDFELAGNQFFGELPSSLLTSLTMLTYLDVNNNQLSGSIPEFGDLSALTYL